MCYTKKKIKFIKYAAALLAAVLLIGLDQWTKWLAVLRLKGNAAYPLWKGIFELQYLENRGAAFGVMQGKKIIFLLFTAFIVAASCYVYGRLPVIKRYLWLHITIILLISGAVGNFIDRIRQDYVVDFFYFKWINFPIFNVADIYVVVSVVMLIIGIFYYKEEDFEEIFPSRGKKG